MSKVQRTWVVDQLPHGGYNRDQALELMNEVEHILFMAGGMVSFVADRVQVGEIADEPLAVSARLIVTWQPYSPMRRAPKVREHAVPPHPNTGMEDPSPAELEETLEVEDEAGLDEEEELERDLTTIGPPRPDPEL